ncbi:MAG: four helix bundle protein [Planctomycetaceae bacterium]|nr:four helix bundle protein [Planctomycetaceae bacterium]
MRNSDFARKSYAFAIRIVNLTKWLHEKKEYILSKQVLRAGTSIGAMIREAEHAESDADYIHKLSIALKEANEVEYWLSLLKDTDYIGENQHTSIDNDCQELKKLLVSSIKTLKLKLAQKMKTKTAEQAEQ